MTAAAIALATVTAVVVIGTLAVGASIAMERGRQLLALAFADGYRDGWRDGRDGRPPREFP